jgi:hypothetical protein
MARAKKEVRLCSVCSAPLEYWQKKTCSKSCYGITQRGADFDRHSPKSNIKYRPVQRVTDKEQAKLNISIDRRFDMDLTSRVLSPGHPDFEAVCKTITPIHLVKKTKKIVGMLDEIDGGWS